MNARQLLSRIIMRHRTQKRLINKTINLYISHKEKYEYVKKYFERELSLINDNLIEFKFYSKLLEPKK